MDFNVEFINSDEQIEAEKQADDFVKRTNDFFIMEGIPWRVDRVGTTPAIGMIIENFNIEMCFKL